MNHTSNRFQILSVLDLIWIAEHSLAPPALLRADYCTVALCTKRDRLIDIDQTDGSTPGNQSKGPLVNYFGNSDLQPCVLGLSNLGSLQNSPLTDRCVAQLDTICILEPWNHIGNFQPALNMLL